jgi:F-type H+-transporting ATPase subunit beta
MLGKVFGAYGQLIDGNIIQNQTKKNIYSRNLEMADINIKGDILWTGIKIIDFFAPL